MLTAVLLAGALQLTFTPEPPKVQPHHPASEVICRRIALAGWKKPRLICLSRTEWREWTQRASAGQKEALSGTR